jgi:hypothetical protein
MSRAVQTLSKAASSTKRAVKKIMPGKKRPKKRTSR